MQIILDSIDGLAPFDEDPERFQLRPEADLVEVSVLLPPEPEFMEPPASEVIHVLDAIVLHPGDEVPESIIVCLYRSGCHLATPLCQEHLLGLARREGLEVLCHWLLEPP